MIVSVTDLKVLAMRVRAGVKLLDKKIPNWRKIIKRHEAQFDFESGDHCVLGTLKHFSGRMRVLRQKAAEKNTSHIMCFVRASERLLPGAKHDETLAKNYGFNWFNKDTEADVLDALWRAEIGI